MEKVKQFLINYRGAIIGGIVAIVALLLNLHKALIVILIVIVIYDFSIQRGISLKLMTFLFNTKAKQNYYTTL